MIITKEQVKKLPDCVDTAECHHKFNIGFRKICLISIHIPNGLHNECKAKRFPNAHEKVNFT